MARNEEFRATEIIGTLVVGFVFGVASFAIACAVFTSKSTLQEFKDWQSLIAAALALAAAYVAARIAYHQMKHAARQSAATAYGTVIKLNSDAEIELSTIYSLTNNVRDIYNLIDSGPRSGSDITRLVIWQGNLQSKSDIFKSNIETIQSSTILYMSQYEILDDKSNFINVITDASNDISNFALWTSTLLDRHGPFNEEQKRIMDDIVRKLKVHEINCTDAFERFKLAVSGRIKAQRSEAKRLELLIFGDD